MDLIITPDIGITTRVLDEWRYNICAFPLPPQITPLGGRPLATVDPEVLMTTPPQLIAHVQRTAAQGGLQIVSPRQTPFSQMMIRRSGDRRELGDHDVGSIADADAEWPTIDGASFDDLLPDEPLAPMRQFETVRTKTETETLVRGDTELADPVLTCLVKGRALIDILRRSDVAGGPDAMAELLAAAWSIPVERLMELEAYTLGLEGSLQRHAMRVDDVYPTLYAPIQYRSVIAMGVSGVSKDVLPYNTAIDWRRARVFCEAVFYNSCVLEGLPIKRMGGMMKPGDPATKANRRGTMTFSPAPGIAWTHDPSTFSVFPNTIEPSKRCRDIPVEVRQALQRYVERVRPVSFMLAAGKRIDTMQTVALDTPQLTGETLAHSYHRSVRTMTTGTARGKQAAATVRNAIYEVLEGAPISIQLRLARYISIAKRECRIHLEVSDVPDSVIDDLACRFYEVGSIIRDKVVREAVFRGHTADDWWNDITAQVPGRYALMKEGSMSWSKVGMWLVFKEPTNRWTKLRGALHWSALRDAENRSVGSVPLPPIKGSKERVLAAAQAVVKGMSRAFAGYYQGVSDVAHALARAASDMGKKRTEATLLEGAYLWLLRARALRAANVHPVAHDEETPSMNHFRVPTTPMDILVKPAPYQAYHAWKTHMERSPWIPHAVKKHFMTVTGPVISRYFKELGRPILVGKESKITKYLNNPYALGEDMERAWAMLIEDVKVAVDKFAHEVEVMAPYPPVPKQIEQNVYEDLTVLCAPEEVSTQGGSDFYTVLGLVSYDEIEGIEEDLYSLPDHLRLDMLEGTYRDVEHLLATMEDMKNAHIARSNTAQENVK